MLFSNIDKNNDNNNILFLYYLFEERDTRNQGIHRICNSQMRYFQNLSWASREGNRSTPTEVKNLVPLNR